MSVIQLCFRFDYKFLMGGKAEHDYNFNNALNPAEEEIYHLVLKEMEVRKEISTLERNIYSAEGEYLAETASDGNIVRGWEVSSL